jgi:hypothetical protein
VTVVRDSKPTELNVTVKALPKSLALASRDTTPKPDDVGPPAIENKELGVEVPESDYSKVSKLDGCVEYLATATPPRR